MKTTTKPMMRKKMMNDQIEQVGGNNPTLTNSKPNTKELLLLVDGENLLHRSFHKFANLKTQDGKKTGAIFGFFKSLHYMVTRFNPDRVIITFDNGHSPERDKLLPTYKGHRKNIAIDYESLQKQKRIIRNILGYLRIPYIFDKHHTTVYEGDDFLAYLALNAPGKVLIVSSDKDFNQLISKKVTIFNPSKDDRVNLRNCRELFGYEPHETADYLSLVGDTSDDIPGFKGIGPKKARQFLDRFESIENSFGTGFWPNEDEVKEIWHRNRILIDLKHFINIYPMSNAELPLVHSRKTPNYAKYTEICAKYSLTSMRTSLFMEAFKKLTNGKITD